MFLIMFWSPPQMHLITALTANPSVQSPCRIGRENLFKVEKKKKSENFVHSYLLGKSCDYTHYFFLIASQRKPYQGDNLLY